MPVTLACTWEPRGELPRLKHQAGQLRTLYRDVVIVLPPEADPALPGELSGLGFTPHRVSDWMAGRHAALAESLSSARVPIHYCDLDRLLHWLEACPDELHSVANQIAELRGGLIFGRTPKAWGTHPRAMQETEALFNMIFSHLMGSTMDFGAGSKAFCPEAAGHILNHSPAEAGFAAFDAAWPLLLQQGGFPITYREVDGLAWETPDQGLAAIASPQVRTQAAAAADDDPTFWQARLTVARRIMTAGLDVLKVQQPRKSAG